MSTTPMATGSSLPRSFPEAEVTAVLGAAPVRRQPIRGGGYGSNTRRWCVELDDGRTAFVKLALDEDAAEWLRDEHRGYSSLEAPFLPRLLGWFDESSTLLAIEDLSAA